MASMKEYLKRYESNVDGDDNKKKKKSKKKAKDVKMSGVIVVDRDPVWQKPLALKEEQENDSPDEKPIVHEDIEVKRMRRLEMIRAKRAYNSLADDGSGWVTLSPKHKSRARNDTPSPECLSPRRNQEAGKHDLKDLSPPRKSNRDQLKQPSDEDLSPPRKREPRKHDSDDLSPPRKSNTGRIKQTSDEDHIPPRRRQNRRHDSDDLSPPRKSNRDHTKQASDEDLSPPRSRVTRRHDSDDLSPPRKSNRDHTKQASDEDLSPPRKREARRHDSEDLSPLRKSNRDHMKQDSDEDLSPHRKRQTGRHDSVDISFPRKSNRNIMKQDSDDIQSPARNRETRRHDSADVSPPRKRKQEPIKVEFSKTRPKSGLISGSEMREEILKTKIEDIAKFEKMDPSISGKGAQAVYRDKMGNRISKEEHTKLNKKVEEKPKEKKIEWGVGLAQKREAEEKLMELELEKEKPFARTRDDPELDAMLKERVRWGDPMAHLVKRKGLETLLPDLGNSEKMKESGFIIPQDVPAHSWIKRGIDAAANRYGIRPGRHWDGVDRSTGFEKQLFRRANEKRANESEAYVWSVADM